LATPSRDRAAIQDLRFFYPGRCRSVSCSAPAARVIASRAHERPAARPTRPASRCACAHEISALPASAPAELRLSAFDEGTNPLLTICTRERRQKELLLQLQARRERRLPGGADCLLHQA